MYQTTAVAGTRKLPSRTTVGRMLEFLVTQVTTMVAIHSTSPVKKIPRQPMLAFGGRPVAVLPVVSVDGRGCDMGGRRYLTNCVPPVNVDQVGGSASAAGSGRRPAGARRPTQA